MTLFNRKMFFALSLAGMLLSSVFTLTAQAGQRLDRIMETKVLRVGTPGDYRPFSMQADGSFQGHDIEVIEKMAKELGLSVTFVKSSWPTLAQDLAEDKFDVALGGITRTKARMMIAEFLPAYAPFGKVALTRKDIAKRFTTPESLNQDSVRVIKNPGGTNEMYVDSHLKKAKVTVHPNNAEIPQMIAEGKGDIMITETAEAILYSKKDKRLAVLFLDHPLTPVNYMGFMLQKDDPDFVRVMHFGWDLLHLRGDLKATSDKWLK